MATHRQHSKRLKEIAHELFEMSYDFSGNTHQLLQDTSVNLRQEAVKVNQEVDKTIDSLLAELTS